MHLVHIQSGNVLCRVRLTPDVEEWGRDVMSRTDAASSTHLATCSYQLFSLSYSSRSACYTVSYSWSAYSTVLYRSDIQCKSSVQELCSMYSIICAASVQELCDRDMYHAGLG